MQITRRHVLALLAATTAAAGVGAGGLALRWWRRSPGEGLKVLSRDEYEFVQAVAEAWLPPGGEPEISGAEANVGAFLDETLVHAEGATAELLKLLFQGLDDKPLGGWFHPYRRLPLADRQVILHDWMHHDNPTFRRAIAGVMALLGMGYTIHPMVAEVLRPSFGCGYGR